MLGLVAVLASVPGQVHPGHLGSGDSVRPRDTETVIESVVPSLPSGVVVDVVGSDTFLRLRSRGHAVEIPGYEGEPYVRIDADGSVWLNAASSTSVLNGDRYGNVDLSSFVPSAEPRWDKIADDATVMWHDHRSHWMSPKTPAVVDADGTVQEFAIPVRVDGTVHTVNGTLYLRHRASLWWWASGILATAVMVALALLRRRLAAVVTIATGGVASVVGVVQWLGLPAGARVTPLLAVFGALAASIGTAGVVVSRGGAVRARLVGASMHAGAGAMLVAVAAMTADHVRAAYVPGLGWEWVVRVLVPVVLAVGVVAAIDGAWRVVRGDVAREPITN